MAHNSCNFVRSFYSISWNYELCKGTSISFCPYSTLQVSEDQKIFMGWLIGWLTNVNHWELIGKRNRRYEVLQTDFLWEWSRAERITSKVVLFFFFLCSQFMILWLSSSEVGRNPISVPSSDIPSKSFFIIRLNIWTKVSISSSGFCKVNLIHMKL